jgi:2-hydroxychromene-2-carboxylate isomerase
MWEEPKKMDDAAVIRDALDASGFDGRAILEGTQEQSIKDKLIANTEASVARGNFGSPTFFVGDEMYFGKDRLREVEEEIVSATQRAR